MRKRGATFNPSICLINPCFSLGDKSRVLLDTQERAAIDALLEHRAADDHIQVVKAMLETAIRAVRITHKEAAHLYEPGVLAESQRVLMRAALALLAAEQRFDRTGVYGLDGQGRKHVREADELIADSRKPGRITRRVWLLAHRQNLATRAGIAIPQTLEGIESCNL